MINLKGKLALCVSAMAVAAFAGGAYAATQESAPSSRQAFLSDVAKRLHVTPAQLSAALKGAAIDQLNAAVAAGRLTKAQADALKQQIQKGDVLPGPGGPGGVGGIRFPGQPWLFHRFTKPGIARMNPGIGGKAQPARPGPLAGAHGPLAAAAKYLGLTPTQLLDQLRSGKTMAEIAKSRGKSLSGLGQAIRHSLPTPRFGCPPRGKLPPGGPAAKGSSAGAPAWIPAPLTGSPD